MARFINHQTEYCQETKYQNFYGGRGWLFQRFVIAPDPFRSGTSHPFEAEQDETSKRLPPRAVGLVSTTMETMDELETLDRRRRAVHRDRSPGIRAARHVAHAGGAASQGICARDRASQQRFWPTDVAAGIVGGAVGTAAAIATAPFRSDRYATNDAYTDRYSGPNGFVCQTGTMFRGEDGRMHLCQ
jgi:hypothetical protein